MWHNWSKRKRWLISLAGLLTLAVTAVTCASCSFLRVPAVNVPAGISKGTQTVRLTGKSVKVDSFLPQTPGAAPVVIVAHGFSRNRKTMAGWGSLLAQEGFIAVVPDLPFWSDHAGNGRALAELLTKVKSGGLDPQAKAAGRAALVGFSAGGLSTLLAAARDTNVSCWVGLDPVGMGRQTQQAAALLKIPCFVLRAEPAPWNAHGNAREMFAALPGPAFSLVVTGATHVDAENPTSRAAEWACGKSDPARREVFGRYLLASLRTGLLADEAALRTLHAATNDAAVYEVTLKRPESLR
jgi:dienelactone hydrolase